MFGHWGTEYVGTGLEMQRGNRECKGVLVKRRHFEFFARCGDRARLRRNRETLRNEFLNW